jgi:hypothetical protein
MVFAVEQDLIASLIFISFSVILRANLKLALVIAYPLLIIGIFIFANYRVGRLPFTPRVLGWKLVSGQLLFPNPNPPTGVLARNVSLGWSVRVVFGYDVIEYALS